MGTSASSKGSRGINPLVPDWADDQPGSPLPKPETNRLTAFRGSFGRFVSGGGQVALYEALNKFATSATGGASVGPRRLGPTISAGGVLGQSLRSLAQGQDLNGLKLADYAGRPADLFAQAIAKLVCGETPDAPWIAGAVNEAIDSAFDLDASFDPQALTDDCIAAILVEFLSISIFQLVLNEAGDAWARSISATEVIDRENQILDLTKSIVDPSLRDSLGSSVRRFTSSDIQTYMRKAAREVWSKWERYSE